MGLQIGFPEILIEAFSDEDRNLDPINKLTINPFSFDSADEQTLTISKDVSTLIRGDGTKERFDWLVVRYQLRVLFLCSLVC